MTQWMTVANAAKYVDNVSERTIRDAIKAGELIAYPVGKGGTHIRLRAEDIDEWMTSRSWEPRSA